MIKDRSREKLLNAILYFVENTRQCGKTKLYKLLYFLDFQHYSQVGRSVTGLEYFAWPMGPVPKVLHDEFKSPAADAAEMIELGTVVFGSGKRMLKITPKRPFDPTHFSKRELRLLESLAEQYKDALAEKMIEATHLENLPWHQIYEVQRKKQGQIPYEYALRKGEFEEITKLIAEHKSFLGNYK
ncbi:MAG: Panacea domain-containing protein [Steroidobacteraceae bacterium]